VGRYPSSKQWDQRQDSGLDSTASRTPLILWRWPSGDPFAWSVLFRLSGRRFSCYLGKLHLVLPFWLGEVIVINQKSDERGNPSTITQIILWPSITSRLPSVKPEASYLNHRFARRNRQRQSQRVPRLFAKVLSSSSNISTSTGHKSVRRRICPALGRRGRQ
jgi:hypothetical protein